MSKCEATGKTQYSNRRSARMALDKLMVRRNGHKTERTAYSCRFCGKWHLSSQGDKQPIRTPRLAPSVRWRWTGNPPPSDEEE